MIYFSIIIPTYNRADIISSTIESVINQMFTDWELIIVDDGGHDNTKEVVQSYKDSRIKYFWKENGERGAARNYGVQKSTGKYVFFLDSDDLIYTNHLQHAFEQLNQLNQPEFFHSRYEEVYLDKKVQVEKLNQENIWPIIQKQNKFACQFFLRLDIAKQFPFSENRKLNIGEDWLVILQIGLKYKLHVSNTVTSAIVQHKNRSMEISNYKTILDSRDIIIENLEQINIDSVKPIIKNVNFELTSLANLSAAVQANKKYALKATIRLFLKNPLRVCKQKRTLAIIKYLFR